MPDRRPPFFKLSAATVTKTRSPRTRARRSRRTVNDNSTLNYWIAGVLIVTLIALIIADWEAPAIRAWYAGDKPDPLPDKPTIAPITLKPAPAPVVPKLSAEEIRMKKLRERAAIETKKLIERTAPAAAVAPPPAPAPQPPPAPIATSTTAPAAQPPATPPGSPVPPNPENQPPFLTDAQPPVAKPAAPAKAASPARAMAVELIGGKLTRVQIAAYQVALERLHFSCGFIDGDQGMRTQRMLRAFQTSRGLPVTGVLDQPTRDAIGEPGEPFQNYIITEKDVASIMPKPDSWIAKSKAPRLGYNDIWEMLAEKFHCTRSYLKMLNPGHTDLLAGTEIIGPKVFPAAPIPKAASLRIYLGETTIEALDASGNIIAFFPCSIAKDKEKRPHGLLTVKVVDPNPDYTFDPALFVDAAKAENITHKMMIPPGPRNPVGTTWVGLSLPGYGIHGTPDPESISRTQSHGCFRLANWNAEKVIKMVKVGTPVDVQD